MYTQNNKKKKQIWTKPKLVSLDKDKTRTGVIPGEYETTGTMPSQ